MEKWRWRKCSISLSQTETYSCRKRHFKSIRASEFIGSWHRLCCTKYLEKVSRENTTRSVPCREREDIQGWNQGQEHPHRFTLRSTLCKDLQIKEGCELRQISGWICCLYGSPHHWEQKGAFHWRNCWVYTNPPPCQSKHYSCRPLRAMWGVQFQTSPAPATLGTKCKTADQLLIWFRLAQLLQNQWSSTATL